MTAATRGVWLLLFAMALHPVIALAQGGPLFHFTEPPGPHAVGLKVVRQYDFSRTYLSRIDELGKPAVGERARPIQTLIWYPAVKNGGKPMTVGDYNALRATETDFAKKALAADDDPTRGLAPTLKDPMWAVRDAPSEAGKFPVVIYAPSFSSEASENADLCEYLASHGYLVLASADMGAGTRNMTNDVAGIDAQARDISFLIGYAQSLPDADPSEVAVAGFSWGGISNLFAAARDNRIDALVALDGSMRYYPGLVKQAGDVHPEQMTIPLMAFTQGEFTMEDQERYLNDPAKNQGPNVLNAWTHGDLVTVHMLGLAHGEFSSMFQRNENFWKEAASFQKADYGRQDAIASYAWVARYTQHFLDACLMQDAVAMAWLKKTPSENGAPAHFLSVSYRAAKGIAPTLEGFRAELGRRGFDHAAEVYAEMKKEGSEFKLQERALEEWGDDLTRDSHMPEAIAILGFNVSLYPDSSDAYGHLAGAYAKNGQKQLAIDNYRKALEKNPENEEARKQLAELEKKEPDGK